MIAKIFDVCQCGDYRQQHRDGWADCDLCGGGPEIRGMSPWGPCRQFRLSQRMEPTWKWVTA